MKTVPFCFAVCPGGYEEIPVQDEQLSASSFFIENKTIPENEKEYAPFNSRLNNAVYKGSYITHLPIIFVLSV